MNDNDCRIVYFYFCKVTQCRPTFFIVKTEICSKKKRKERKKNRDLVHDRIMPLVPVWPEGLVYLDSGGPMQDHLRCPPAPSVPEVVLWS